MRCNFCSNICLVLLSGCVKAGTYHQRARWRHSQHRVCGCTGSMTYVVHLQISTDTLTQIWRVARMRCGERDYKCNSYCLSGACTVLTEPQKKSIWLQWQHWTHAWSVSFCRHSSCRWWYSGGVPRSHRFYSTRSALKRALRRQHKTIYIIALVT